MIKEYYKFIKEYILLVEIKAKYLIINLLSALFYKGFSILLPLIASFLIKCITENNVSLAYISIGLFALVYFLYTLSLYINYRIYGYNINFCYDILTKKLMKKLSSVDNNFTRKYSKGRIINSINSDIIDIGDMNDEISELLMGVIQIVAVLVIVCFVNIYLAGLLIIFALIYITVRNRMDRKINYYHNKVKVDDDKYSTLLTQIISGLQEIKTFNMLDKLRHNLESIQKKFNRDYKTKRKYMTIRDNDTRLIIYIFRFMLYLILILLIAIEEIDVSILILIIAYHERLVEYINDLIYASSTIRETNTAVRRVNDILNYSSTDIPFGNLYSTELFSMIEFKNVSLAIKNNLVLNNINLQIAHNEFVAIVGETGSGKTMLFNLLLRLYEPTKGTITFDNTSIYDFNLESYSKLVSIVNQKPFIFNMSIRRNLNFVDRNIKRQIAACKRAGIHDFIETLPNGYNTILRENGSNISGGQKQMISIARTILTDAEIFLLDDITTSLDPDTAKLVPKLIHELKEDHTIIMITKKPDLMRLADRIIVLDKGSIIDAGTHKELMARCEIYQVLQSRKSPSRIGVFNND